MSFCWAPILGSKTGIGMSIEQVRVRLLHYVIPNPIQSALALPSWITFLFVISYHPESLLLKVRMVRKFGETCSRDRGRLLIYLHWTCAVGISIIYTKAFSLLISHQHSVFFLVVADTHIWTPVISHTRSFWMAFIQSITAGKQECSPRNIHSHAKHMHCVVIDTSCAMV